MVGSARFLHPGGENRTLARARAKGRAGSGPPGGPRETDVEAAFAVSSLGRRRPARPPPRSAWTPSIPTIAHKPDGTPPRNPTSADAVRTRDGARGRPGGRASGRGAKRGEGARSLHPGGENGTWEKVQDSERTTGESGTVLREGPRETDAEAALPVPSPGLPLTPLDLTTTGRSERRGRAEL